jgi:hypothetical protein
MHHDAKDLSISILSLDETVKVISTTQNLGNRLHSSRFSDVLLDNEIKEVAQYILTLRKGSSKSTVSSL